MVTRSTLRGREATDAEHRTAADCALRLGKYKPLLRIFHFLTQTSPSSNPDPDDESGNRANPASTQRKLWKRRKNVAEKLALGTGLRLEKPLHDVPGLINHQHSSFNEH